MWHTYSFRTLYVFLKFRFSFLPSSLSSLLNICTDQILFQADISYFLLLLEHIYTFTRLLFTAKWFFLNMWSLNTRFISTESLNSYFLRLHELGKNLSFFFLYNESTCLIRPLINKTENPNQFWIWFKKLFQKMIESGYKMHIPTKNLRASHIEPILHCRTFKVCEAYDHIGKYSGSPLIVNVAVIYRFAFDLRIT